MIRFDPERETVFGPFDLKLDDAPSKCLMIFDDEIWEDYVLANPDLGTQEVRNASGRVFDNFRYVEAGGEKILLVNPTTGAAGAVCDMELLIASGISKIVAFGTCGRLDKNIAKNTIILPTAAYREEGTSYHYLPESDEIEADVRLLDVCREVFAARGLATLEGKVWTTDAVYRETAGKVHLMKERSCVAVEMELSALTAVAQYRGVDFTEFLIAEDTVDGEAVEPLERKNAEIFEAAIEIVGRI